MSPHTEDETEGKRVGRYIVYGELAAGGMASVHLGRLVGPRGFSKTVAIKRLHQHLATEPEFVTMLIDEAKLASSIHHPNVVSSLDVVSEGDEILLVMDYVEGETLATLLRSSRKDPSLRPPQVSVIVRILTDVLAGLHAAHTAKTQRGRPLHIVHRDVSPQNIMVGVDGIARVLDFGIAKAAHRGHSTRPGRIKGKFAYMSPEQVRGQPVDARTDVFAAGVVLWECLTKRRLFPPAGDGKAEPRVTTTAIEAPSVHNPQISPALDRVVLRALNHEREARFASAAEFADALAAAAEQSSSVEVGRWVASGAKRPLDQQRRLFDDIDDIDDIDENTVDDRIDALAARTQEKTRVLGGPRETSKSSRPLGLLSAVAVPLRSSPPPRWSRLALVAIGASLLLLAGTRVFWRSNDTTASAPVPASAPVTGHVGAKAKPMSPAGPEGALPPPVVVATDLPRLPQPASSSERERPAAGDAAARASATTTPTSATKARSLRSRATKPQREKRIPKPVAIAAPPVTKAEPVPAATETPAAPSCDPPYRIDALGIRRVRQECL